MTIPERVWFSKSEAAELTGQSVATINRRIREGRRGNPGPHAIGADQLRDFGAHTKLHRSYIYGEPRNLSPINNRLTDTDKEDIARRVVRLWLHEIAGNAARLERTG